MAYSIKNKPVKEKKAFSIPKKEERKTYDIYVNGDTFLNFDTKEDAESWLVGNKYEHFALKNNPKIEIKERISEPYRLGEMWRDDFDYTGMVKKGSEADICWGEKKLNKLFDSYEDVNYHKDSSPLWEAIQELKKGDRAKAEVKLAEFREINKKRLKEWGE